MHQFENTLKAKRFGQMHSIEIPALDKTSYTRFNDALTSIPQWNTRDISTEWIPVPFAKNFCENVLRQVHGKNTCLTG